MAAPPVTVTMQVRPTRSNQPFPISFFRGMNCPPSIEALAVVSLGKEILEERWPEAVAPKEALVPGGSQDLPRLGVGRAAVRER